MKTGRAGMLVTESGKGMFTSAGEMAGRRNGSRWEDAAGTSNKRERDSEQGRR